ncbi:hypothetical protein ACEN19_00045 [Corynebacterium auriscanis]|uniref:hypothetical protein n=1 Tax=Corynebacterium auriscanis TaxID=99807 RepID=UPI003CE79415
MASVFNSAVEQALANQSWFMRRKDTLVAIAGTILQIANLGALYASNGPEWVNILIALVIGAAQIVVHAGTKGAITPSMVRRLEQAGAEANLDRTPASGIAVAGESEPVEAVEDFPPYAGAHRLEE